MSTEPLVTASFGPGNSSAPLLEGEDLDTPVLWCSIQPAGHGPNSSRYFGPEHRAREESEKRPEREFVALSLRAIEDLEPRWRDHAMAALERLRKTNASG